MDLGDGCPASAEETELIEDGTLSRAAILSRLSVHTLICGGISRELSASIEGRGVRVLAFVSGEVECVVEAFLAGTLNSGAFCMPGCGCGRHRRRRGRSGDEP
jgi:predicted Fe-Mo cluster-binding NifX family protein